ncbi:DUF1684 domain-containing protein [Fluviicola taffensis]|uniref:DUF1684 domain-containing protein n=1 Tax=Fluviicola taffensis (strain DSM 16823 / NCIMB 13979 / RW262) TaxID=755732 RepID=F2IE03_FLUTR|nr:DUF1684 domain-containing protein [Fluviicola taffensis]AEA45567.1 protein of unknown function DUF1684 [Fluviicola taffensis DSM 16823]
MRIIGLVFIGLISISTSFAQNKYADSLQLERQKHEKEFLSQVLDEEERKIHPEICFFPIDTSWIIEADFTKEIGPAFVMPMSKERTVYYRKVGTLSFKVNDTLCKLNVYQNLELTGKKEYKNYYFVPFKDGTTAISTYGAGKYLDCYFHKKAKKVTIDFNTSYHPYCAYSDRYSCPIVPKENTIPVSILAGECYISHD